MTHVKRKRGRPKKGELPPNKKRDIDSKRISTTDGVKYDSPLTVRGTTRKRNFAIRRYARLNYYNTQLTKDEYLKLKEEAIIKFLSFCPRYSTIYTNVTGEREDALYIDVMVCQNDRLYRITRLVAIILKKKMARAKSRGQIDKITWRPDADDFHMKSRDNMKYTELIVKMLSQEMFKCDDGYLWQDLSQIYMFDCAYKPKQQKHAIPKNIPNVLDNNDTSDVESTPRKSYRIR